MKIINYCLNEFKNSLNSKNVKFNTIFDIYTTPRRNEKNDFEKEFLNLLINTFFGNTIHNDWKHWDIKVVSAEVKTNCFGSEPNYEKAISFWILANGMKRTHILMRKPIYFVLAILKINETVMCVIWCGYKKHKYL